MPFDRSEFKDSIASRESSREQELMPLIRALQGAAPVMNAMMTESDAWNRYLSILQGFVTRIKAAQDQAAARLSGSGVWEPSQLIKLKSDVLTCGAMLEAFTIAIELPKALMDGGEAAQEIVSKFETKHPST